MALVVAGCTPTLQNEPFDLAQLGPNKGVVIGSVVVRTRDEEANFPLSLEDKAWYAEVVPLVGFLSRQNPFEGRAVSVRSNGKEVNFVAVMDPGAYEVIGFSEREVCPCARIRLSATFAVAENAKTYIGRLVVTIPKVRGNFDGMLFKSRGVAVAVEDAQEETLVALAPKYGDSLGNGVRKSLMAAVAEGAVGEGRPALPPPAR